MLTCKSALNECQRGQPMLVSRLSLCRSLPQRRCTGPHFANVSMQDQYYSSTFRSTTTRSLRNTTTTTTSMQATRIIPPIIQVELLLSTSAAKPRHRSRLPLHSPSILQMAHQELASTQREA